MSNNLPYSACVLIASWLLAGHVSASDYEILFEKGEWRTDVNIYDDRSLSCETFSFGRNDTRFAFFSFDDGGFIIYIYKEEWEFGAHSTDTSYQIRIDQRSPWDIHGNREESSVMSFFDYDDPAVRRFFREIYNGTSMALMSENGNRIDSFSLSGSAANLNAHSECRNRILGSGRGKSSDPFASGVTDPF
jgi:hypothetical protein